MAFELHHLTAQEQWDWVRRGEVSALELTKHHLQRVARHGPRLGAFARVDADAARRLARRIDADGQGVAPLSGVPIAEKELARRAGTVSGSGSRLFADRPASTSDAITEAVDATGAVVLGATTAPEFGLTGFTEPAGRPPARTPWDVDAGAGGSSGGAAAAVAAGLVPFAVGSDGGGSIRIPAAMCGVVGVKPSRGRVPAQGGHGSLGGLTTAGPIARTVADAAMLLDALVSPDGRPAPPTTALVAPGQSGFLASAVRGEGRYSVGVLRGSVWDDAVEIRLDPAAAAAVERAATALDDLGHGRDEVRLPGEDYADFFRVLWQASAATIPAHTTTELDLLESYTRELVLRGRALPTETVVGALSAAAAFERRAVAAFAPFDAVLTPSLALPPRPVGWFTADADVDTAFDRQVQVAPYSSFVNVAGLPAITLPLGDSDTGFPTGVQLIGRPGGEATLFALARQLERRFDWSHRHPPAFW